MMQRLLLGFTLLTAPVQAQRLSFEPPDVELTGDDTTLVTHHGRASIEMRTGAATWKDVSFQDGTIELDIATRGTRSFVYLLFRMQSGEEYEELYFRPHKPTHPDFIQYSPVYRRESNWQLYHGPGYTAAAPMPANEWVHVKVVVSGARAAVFVAGASEPQLVIPLAREPKPGFIAVRSFVPAGTELDGPATHFSNLEIKPGVIDATFPTPAVDEPLAGIVTTWKVSETFVAPDDDVIDLPTPTGWKPIAAEASGLIVLLKHRARPEGARRASVLAKLDLRADRAETVRFDFGYSDEVSVFLNGRLLFSGDDSYSFNFPRRQGLIGLDQASVFLPLERGANELILAVTDRFGGWGWMGRLDRPDSVAIVE